MRVFLFLLLTSFYFSSCGESQAEINADTPLPDSTEYYRKLIDAETKSASLDTFFARKFVDGTFSGAVLVAQHGVILLEEAFGWENHEQKDSLTLESSFQLASVSKQFTAAAILLLVQEGKISLQDSIRRFFPELPYTNVTLHHLLSHRSGLDKYTNICDNYFREKCVDPPSHYTNDSVISLFSRISVRAIHHPDEKYDYSNTGYVLLAAVVEQVSGQPFHRFLKTNFFEPLGMTHTWVNGDGQEHAHRTRGYYKSWNRWDDGFLDEVTGDKGVYSSVHDLFLWDRALRNGVIIHHDLLAKAFTGYSDELTGKKTWNYGYGWRTVDFPDGARAVFHNGWWHGYTSCFYRGISDDVTIIILCNKFNRGIYNVQPILKILGAHFLETSEEDASTDSADAHAGSK